MGAWSGIFGVTFVLAATQMMGTVSLPMLGWLLYRIFESLRMAGFLLVAFGGFVVAVAMLYSAASSPDHQV